MNRLIRVRAKNLGKKVLLAVCFLAIGVAGYFLARMILVEYTQQEAENHYKTLVEEVQAGEEDTVEERLEEVQPAALSVPRL